MSSEAHNDACEMVNEFIDQIAGQLVENEKASNDSNNDYDGGDSYFHESIVDRDYSPREAIDILEEYSDHEETDSGLWEGLEWDRVLAAKAAYTYGNAVAHEWQELIEMINDDWDDDRDTFLREWLEENPAPEDETEEHGPTEEEYLTRAREYITAKMEGRR